MREDGSWRDAAQGGRKEADPLREMCLPTFTRSLDGALIKIMDPMVSRFDNKLLLSFHQEKKG